MNDPDWQGMLRAVSGKDLEQRKRWYSPAAAAYASARPTYPEALIRHAIASADLSADSRLLEVGCGPGTATTAFARLGCAMVCLEPNPDQIALARHHCRGFPAVALIQTSFEEWDVEPESFDAVVAASSFHWIPGAVGYPKAHRALKETGWLLLLWNKELQPDAAMQALFADVYAAHAPHLGAAEDRATQERILAVLGQMPLDSGLFTALLSETVETAVTYSADRSIALLSTYSPYLSLPDANRRALFDGLRACIHTHAGGELRLTYLSALHGFRKA
jgi:SAM-dependent methyltransferase